MKKLVLALCTGFGLGYSPVMPGTAGTLLGIPLVFLWPSNPWLILVLVVVGVWSSQVGEKYLGHDSPRIVIDEIAGFTISMYGLGPYPNPTDHLALALVAFVIFRLLDILKPQPVKTLQSLPGGWGVMADDLAAGLLTNIILRLLQQLL